MLYIYAVYNKNNIFFNIFTEVEKMKYTFKS